LPQKPCTAEKTQFCLRASRMLRAWQLLVKDIL